MSREDLNAGWTSGYTAQPSIAHPGGIFRFAIGQSNVRVAVGLASERVGEQFMGIDHALLLRDDGTVQVFEKGVAVSNPRRYVAGNIFSLRVIAPGGGLSLVSYVLNGEILHDAQNPVLRFPLVARVLLSHEPSPIISPTVSPWDISEPELTADEVKDMGAVYTKLTRQGPPVHPHVEVGYNIYRSTDPNLPKKQWKRLNPVLLSETQFKDTTAKAPGVTYYYYVTSVNAYGIESHPSKVFSAESLPHNTIDEVM
jgi:hypothetical protein